MAWPTPVVVGVPAMAVVRAVGGWTPSTGTRVVEAVSSAPVFASWPRTDTAGARFPAAVAAQLKMKAALCPPAMVCGVAGVGAPHPASRGVTTSDVTLADAPPGSEATSRSVKAWPTVTLPGFPSTERTAARAAGDCTTTWAVAAVTVSAAPEEASVPATAALTARVPAAEPVHDQENACESPAPTRSGGAGLTAPQVAAVPACEGVTEVTSASPVPPFRTVRVMATGWPTSAVRRPGVKVAARLELRTVNALARLPCCPYAFSTRSVLVPGARSAGTVAVIVCTSTQVTFASSTSPSQARCRVSSCAPLGRARKLSPVIRTSVASPAKPLEGSIALGSGLGPPEPPPQAERRSSTHPGAHRSIRIAPLLPARSAANGGAAIWPAWIEMRVASEDTAPWGRASVSRISRSGSRASATLAWHGRSSISAAWRRGLRGAGAIRYSYSSTNPESANRRMAFRTSSSRRGARRARSRTLRRPSQRESR